MSEGGGGTQYEMGCWAPPVIRVLKETRGGGGGGGGGG